MKLSHGCLNETGGNVIRNLVWVSEPVANRLNAWMSEGEWLTSWREKDYANIYSTCCTKLTCLLENPSFTLREVLDYKPQFRKLSLDSSFGGMQSFMRRLLEKKIITRAGRAIELDLSIVGDKKRSEGYSYDLWMHFVIGGDLWFFMFNHLKCKEIACYQVLLSPKEPENNVTFFWGRAMAASSEDICSSSDTSTLTIVEEFCRRE
ncbi:unnamed protein product [Camellia sinensis]